MPNCVHSKGHLAQKHLHPPYLEYSLESASVERWLDVKPLVLGCARFLEGVKSIAVR